MPKHIRVFLASPGDVVDERSLAIKVLSDLPYDPLLRGKITIDAVAWDNIDGPPMEATLKPQEAIMKGLPLPSACDIFIAVFWSRIGTVIEIDGKNYMSGTHYEYEEALQGWKSNGSPRILVYKRTQKVLLDPDENGFSEKIKQHNKVKDFFSSFNDKLTGEALGGYNSYSTPDRFREDLESHLKSVIQSILQDSDEEKKPFPNIKITSKIKINKNSKSKEYSTRFETNWEGSPFPGLRAFRPEDEPIYFGRGREIDTLVNHIRSKSFVTVAGASGSGKSSLIGAGLIPRLISTSQEGYWSIINFTPDNLGNSDPFSSLVVALVKKYPNIDSYGLAKIMREKPYSFYEIIEKTIDSSKEKKLLIFIDQFEEIFTTITSDSKIIFIELIKLLSTSTFIKIS